MSWNLFNKLQPKKNVADAREKDFSREYSRIQILEEVTKKLNKDAKKMTDHTSSCARSAGKVGHDLSLTVADYEDDCFMLQEFVKLMRKLEELTQSQAALLQKTAVDPLKKYLNMLAYINTQVKSREKLLQDFTKLQSKVDKLKDKEDTGHNIVKKQNLHKELEPVKTEFDYKNNLLLNNLPQFHDCRLQYMHPIFEALIMSQCRYHQESHTLFDNYLRSILCEDETDDKLSTDISNTLEEIRNLSITSDDK